MNQTEPIRALVVDDSVLYRKVVRDVLEQHPHVEVVGVAANGEIALNKIEMLKPDLLTLDVEMPVLDGLSVLKELRQRKLDTDAIMLSAKTGQSALSTMSALQEGAFDFVLKPNEVDFEASLKALSNRLHPRIDAYVSSRTSVPEKVGTVGCTGQSVAPAAAEVDESEISYVTHANELAIDDVIQIAVIGISTGGPAALTQELPKLPADLPVPVMIVQHMPPMFTKSLADDLNRLCPMNVVEAEDGQEVTKGTIYIAPGGKQMKIENSDGGVVVRITSDPPERNCRPSVDYLFRSASQHYGSKALGVIMTGMGDDGSLGAKLLRRKNARIIAQHEASCTVYGMPRSIITQGLADLVCPLDQMAKEIKNCVQKSRGI